MPRDSDSLKLLGITTFIGDENNWKASMAVHGALAEFNPQEEDWSEYTERLTFTLPPTELLQMLRRELSFLVVADQQEQCRTLQAHSWSHVRK